MAALKVRRVKQEPQMESCGRAVLCFQLWHNASGHCCFILLWNRASRFVSLLALSTEPFF